MCCEIGNFSRILGSEVFMLHPKKARLSWILVLEKRSNRIESWMVGWTVKRPAARRSRSNEGDALNPVPLIPQFRGGAAGDFQAADSVFDKKEKSIRLKWAMEFVQYMIVVLIRKAWSIAVYVLSYLARHLQNYATHH